MGDQQIALIRGINVGKAKRVAMADLRALLERLGYSEVRTLLNSGNAVFTVPRRSRPQAVAASIEAAFPEWLGVSARVVVLSAGELSRLVAENPLLAVAGDPTRLFAAVLMDKAPRAGLETLGRRDWSPDAFAVGERAAYLWCADGMLESPLAKAFGREVGDAVTSRNWATILKLHALVEQGRVAED